jgi:hypothetical protein
MWQQIAKCSFFNMMFEFLKLGNASDKRKVKGLVDAVATWQQTIRQGAFKKDQDYEQG